MTPRYDLHSHSTASDGTLAPAALVRHAVEQGVDWLALTDHDSTDGIREAQEAVRGQLLRVIPGVEVSVTWQGRVVHIVGLFVDPDDGPLQEGLSALRDYRDQRAQRIAQDLEGKGIPGALEGASRFASGPVLSRTHFARFLVEQGYAASVRKVFKRYLVKGKPGYVPSQWAGLDEAVGWIRGAGGMAVVAHPARYGLTRSKLICLLEAFRACGGTALEVVSGSHSRDDVFSMAHLAKTVGLAGSAGSDYHGPENPWVELGRLEPLPAGVLPVWQTPDWQASASGMVEA